MPMDFHIERRLMLKRHEDIQTKNLYSWAIAEIDDDGNQVGRDMIPWAWGGGFLGTELSVVDRLTYESKDMRGRDLPEGHRFSHRSSIRAKLRPGNPREDKNWSQEPTYRFFGTDRVITNFAVDIVPVAAEDEQGCTTWGSVSYTSEIDFREDTTEDTVQFYLYVPQATYDRYVWNIGQGLADQIYLSLGHVSGFYSEWSPSISAREVKVLAGKEHVVLGGEDDPLPRLGAIGKAELYMTALRNLRPRGAAHVHEDDVVEDLDAPTFQQQTRKGFWKR